MSLRILIVDDDRFMRETLPGVLARAQPDGIEARVQTAGTPDEAIALLDEPEVTGERLVVLSDYNLKAALHGLDVLARVRERRPDAMRLLFSGHTREEIRGLDEARVDGFLEKPFRLQELAPPFWALVAPTAEPRSSPAPLTPHVGGDDASRRRANAARALPREEFVPAVLRAATKGEEGRLRTLYEEAQRRGQGSEAEREATQALVWQNRVLELVATGAPLETTLEALASTVEQQSPGTMASIHLVDETGTKLRHGAAPSLPRAYNAAVDGIPIGAGVGSCGTAAHERRAILVADTQTDPKWADFRELAATYHLAACWSMPILSTGGELRGTIALYDSVARDPTDRELHLIELAANLARVAIESHAGRVALRASESRYRSLFNSIDQGFCVIELIDDAQGNAHDYRFIEVNAAFEAQTGLVDATGRTIREMHPGIESHWPRVYGEVAQTGVPIRFEDRSASMGRWFDVYAFRVGPPAQRRVGVLFSDVTQRKNAEAEREVALRQEKAARAEAAAARARLDAMIFQAPVPIALLHGPEQVFELANSSYEELSGRSAAEIIGRRVRDVFPEVGEGLFALLDSVYRTGEPYVGKEIPVPLRRGGVVHETYIDFLYHPSRGPDGEIEGIIAVAREVTDAVRARKAAEAAAHEREILLQREREAVAKAGSERAKLHDLFMQAPAAIAIVDGPEYVFSFVNPRYEELVGRRAEEFLGRRVQDALPEVVEQGFLALLDRVRETGEPFRAEALPVTLGSGATQRTMYLNFVYQPILVEGKFAGIMAHAVDVTAEVVAQEQTRELAATLDERVRERTRELQQINRDLESFSYAVSHDLRAPLRAVHHLVSVVLQTTQLPEPARAELEATLSSTEAMSRLIDALLGLARAAQSDLRTSEVDITALAGIVARDLALAEPDRRVEVVIAPGLRARGDPRLLRSVLENLLGNAWKFSARRPDARIEVGQASDGAREFYVRDNGVGFDASRAEEMFQAFRRLHAREGFEGTGIGLATVKRIIERHGGRVWAGSRPNEGAVFRFTLP